MFVFIRGDSRKWWNIKCSEGGGQNGNVKWLVGWDLTKGAGNNEINEDSLLIFFFFSKGLTPRTIKFLR